MIDIYNHLYKNFDKKILYIKHNSSFDLLMSKIFPNAVYADSLDNINYYFTYCSVIYNSLLEINKNQYQEMLQRLEYCRENSICFVHDDVVSHTKPEDLQIMLNNNSGLQLINLHPSNKNVMGYTKYGIPYNNLLINKTSNKILLINPEYQTAEMLKKFNLKHDTITSFRQFTNYEEYLSFLLNYKIVASNNIIDRLIAQSVGCFTLDPNSLNIDDQHHEFTKYYFNPVNTAKISDIFINLNFHSFKRNIFNEENTKDLL